MISISKTNAAGYLAKSAAVALLWAVCVPQPTLAQDRRDDRRDDRDYNRDRIVRIEPGTTVAVRTNEYINSERADGRVYTGIVDQDVRDNNGRLAIPRGSRVELVVRVARDNDLILDMDAVTINGGRYGIKAEPTRIES